MRVQFFDHLVHIAHAHFHGIGGCSLQIGIERSIDAQAFAIEFSFTKPLRQLITHQVHKVRRLAGVHALRRQVQRLGLGALRLVLGDGAGFHHRVQHQVAPVDGPVRMAEREK